MIEKSIEYNKIWDLDAMVMDSYLEVAAEDLGYKSVNELKKS
ncbi:hypothetical protein PL371_03740 [Tenacibaculum maritimum]|nr:hypothetical protein [Tenacibaculum maritimum]MDB0610997.1 hypothetical protein [Tenacibaculum maritimum]